MNQTVQLDEIDIAILAILQRQGKTSNVALSKEIGLSPGPTLERVKKLEKTNIIRGYHAELNEQALGIGFTALIQLSLSSQLESAVQSFKKAILEIEEITECYQVTGNFDYQLKVKVPNIPSFEALISKKLGNIEVIRQMQTMVVLSKVKDNCGVPLNNSI